MKVSKKICVIIMAGMLLLTACTVTSNPGASKEEGTTIVTSFYPIYLHTINITKGIDGIEVINMTQPQTGCLHDYQLSPDNIKTLESADLFIINGGGMEGFMDKLLSQIKDLKVIDASENIKLLEGEDGHDANPHVWVSISGAIEQVDHIAKELGRFDEANKELYSKNAREYIEKLEKLKKEMHESLDNLPNKNIITFHEAFPYFAQEFDLNIVATITEEANLEPSAKDLADIISTIEDNKVKAIFIEPQFTSKSPDLISKESGLGLYSLDPIVTGDTTNNIEDDYINKMRENLKVLEEALK
ncbi:MAG: zinc ABC transporter substrate-binding protein [Epulopiscium sp.]|nr:zinc ABC transporter substrate-binding protein [Candidatus Epulonipiscium sp.]